MVVKQIQKKRNNVLVDFEDGEQIVIPYDVFIKNYFSVDEKITKVRKEELLRDSELYNIRQSCFRYLSGRNHSKYELKLKLIRKKYDKFLIEKVLDKMEKDDFINDEKFAQNYFQMKLRQQRGMMKIKADLFKKGISRDIIEFVSSTDNNDETFHNNALLLARKKINQFDKQKFNEKQIKEKLYRFLASRGFTADIISNVLNELEREHG